jgi:hypothetical protein
MSDKFVLMVSDEEEDKHGEITLLETADEAERLIETLLEAGYDRERMHVFSGAEAEFETTYRPVVSIGDGEVAAEAQPEPVQAGNGNGRSASSVRVSSLFRSTRDDATGVYISGCEAAA